MEKIKRHIFITIEDTPENIAYVRREIDNFLYIHPKIGDMDLESDLSE